MMFLSFVCWTWGSLFDCVYRPTFETTLGCGLLLLIFDSVHDLHSFEVNQIL